MKFKVGTISQAETMAKIICKITRVPIVSFLNIES